MFNVGGGELLVIALVALIVVGPEQLPGLLRKAGRYAAQIKSMGDSVRDEFMAGADELDPRRWNDTPKRGKGTADDPILPRSSKPAPTEPAPTEPAATEPTDAVEATEAPAAEPDGETA